MKQLQDYINEKLHISQYKNYKYHPKNRQELVELIAKKNQDIKKGDMLDLNDIDVSEITDICYLFENIKPVKVNMNNWNVSNVTDIHGLFWNNRITEEIHIENWDVRNVESAYGVFYFCTKVKKLDLDKWNLSSCKEFDLMFKGCENLDTHFTDNWKMPTHEITADGMFEGCKYIPKWYKQ